MSRVADIFSVRNHSVNSIPSSETRTPHRPCSLSRLRSTALVSCGELLRQHTFLLAGEAAIDSIILTTVMKDVSRRVQPDQVPIGGISPIPGFRSTGASSEASGVFPPVTGLKLFPSPRFSPTATRNTSGRPTDWPLWSASRAYLCRPTIPPMFSPARFSATSSPTTRLNTFASGLARTLRWTRPSSQASFANRRRIFRRKLFTGQWEVTPIAPSRTTFPWRRTDWQKTEMTVRTPEV